jgi:hypothetical protein
MLTVLNSVLVGAMLLTSGGRGGDDGEYSRRANPATGKEKILGGVNDDD